jgi:hypothetical protein
MMTMSPPSLAAEEQALIDARLETIERMLMGRVPRSDRISIVSEVESQIFELLGDRDPQSIRSEDVIEILRRLDPPEAYLATEIDPSLESRPSATAQRALPAKPRPTKNREGRIGGIIGMGSFGLVLMLPLVYLAAIFFSSEAFLVVGLGVLTLLGIVAGILGLAISIKARREGLLPIFGIVTSVLSLPVWLFVVPAFVLTAF